MAETLGLLRVAAAIGALAVAAGCERRRPGHAVPTALVERDGAFEIRRHPPRLLAVALAAAPDPAAAVEDGVERLFDWLCEAAEGGGVPTAPILVSRPGGAAVADALEVALDVPEGLAGALILPPPEGVRLALRGPRLRAAVGFRGPAGMRGLARRGIRLDRWLRAAGRSHRGDWQVALHDPPWTPPAARRSELVVTLA